MTAKTRASWRASFLVPEAGLAGVAMANADFVIKSRGGARGNGGTGDRAALDDLIALAGRYAGSTLSAYSARP